MEGVDGESLRVGQRRSRHAEVFHHVPGLDGLRGAAVAAVLVYHAGHLSGGFLGVDLFFVLSGYLITSLLLVEHERSGRIDLRGFWGRRMRRLLPALLALLVGVAVYANTIARPVDLARIRGDSIATLFYVANWHNIFRGDDYWDISLAPSPLQHTWSLAIEEQFYLVWPFAVWGIIALLRRRGGGTVERRRLESVIIRIAVAGAVLSFAALVWFHSLGMSTTRLYEGTDTRAGAIFGGIALAVWASRRRHLDPTGGSSLRLEAAGIAAVVGLGVMWFRLDGRSPALYQGLLPLGSVLAVVVIAAVADRRSPVLGRLFSWTPLRWLGLISYGLYLWHWPIFQALELRNGRLPGLDGRAMNDGELLLAKLGLSVLVAVASYFLLERPVRQGRLPVRTRLPLAVGSAVAVLALVVVSTSTEVGGPNTTESAERGSPVAGAPSVLVVGDSVALSVVDRVIEDPARFGVNPMNKARPGCSEVAAGVQVINFARQEVESIAPCWSMIEGAMGELDPDVVLLFIGARPNDWLVLAGAEHRACDQPWQDRYRETMGRFVDELGSTGARVGVATVVHSGEQSLPVEGSEERIDCVNQAIEELVAERPGAFVVDVDGLVCPGGAGTCREEIDGDAVRSDGLHFDPGPGGDAVTAWVLDRLITEGVGD